MSDPGTEWTLEQAAELVLESFVSLLDGCDDDDTVRPSLVWDALVAAWCPDGYDGGRLELTAGEIRRRAIAARGSLARGERVP